MYDRKIMSRTLSFGVSGKLYRNSLIMYDRETETLWSHLLGAAVEGELEGARLESIPAFFGTWKAWREQHPNSFALSPKLSPYGVYGDAYAGYYTSGQTGILGTRKRDKRLEDKDLVLGVMAPAAKAYAFADLEREGLVRDTLAGETIEVVWDPDAGVPEAYLLSVGGRELLPSTPIFWFAWVDFFPGAPLWNGDAAPEVARASRARNRPGATQDPAGPRSASR